MKDKFIEFLTENECLAEFKENINPEENFDVFCNKNWENNPDWVTLAFTWSNTKQKEKFWGNLYQKWYDIATKIRDNNN